MKRIISVILVFCIALTVCACGGSGGADSDAAWKNDVVKSDDPSNPTVMDLFYRNTIGAEILSDDPAVKAVDEKADAMLQKIEDYPDGLTPAEGGKTYYISADGSDTNDGLSPETARQSYMAVKTFLKEGDVVLFRRGDIFRGQMKLISGVSYGAYGEGPKPRIYGSTDGKTGEWTETSTKDVYKYSEVIGNYSNIVFNSGEAVGRPVTKEADITKKELSVYFDGSKIKVYSPNGNPGEIFDHIEIVDGYTVVTGNGDGTTNVKLQNLCVMYGGIHCIGSLGQSHNVEIEGCVLGFAGGKGLFQGGKSLGNAIEFWAVATDIKVHDNYIFQCYDTGITHQGPQGTGTSEFTNIHYTDNLIEYCVWSIEAWHAEGGTYDDVYIENNICRYSGWGWGSLDRPDKNVYSDIQYTSGTHTKPLTITGNIFDRPRRSAINMGDYPDSSLLKLTDNTFIVANNNTRLGVMSGESVNITDDYEAFFKKYFGTYSGNTFTLIK